MTTREKLCALAFFGLMGLAGHFDMQDEQHAADDTQQAIAAARDEMRGRACPDEACRILVARKEMQ